MQKLSDQEIIKNVAILHALGHPLALRVLEYIQLCEGVPEISDVETAMQPLKGVGAGHVRACLDVLEKAQIIQLTGASFANPDNTHVLLNASMPDLAQRIVVEIWSEFYKQEEAA